MPDPTSRLPDDNTIDLEVARMAPRESAYGDRLRIAVIIGSTRRGRLGEPIGRWFIGSTSVHKDMTVDPVDLAEERLPVVYPDFADGVPETVTSLGRRLDAADGFVIVTPEYNHAYPASLKNAIDWFHSEWWAKPVAFVSYGGRAQGIRAVEQLRQVFAELQAVTLRDGVSLNIEDGSVDDGGSPRPCPELERATEQMLDRLAWWARALREARAKEPYPDAG